MLIETSVKLPQISAIAVPLLGLKGQSLLTSLRLKGLCVWGKLAKEWALPQSLHHTTLY